MRFALLSLAALALVVGGCCSPCAMNGRSACDNCPTSTCTFLCPPTLPANRCSGWDFYIPSDLVEGKWTPSCGCQQPCRTECYVGQVVSRTPAVEVQAAPAATPAAAAPAGPAVEAAPAAPAQ